MGLTCSREDYTQANNTERCSQRLKTLARLISEREGWASRFLEYMKPLTETEYRPREVFSLFTSQDIFEAHVYFGQLLVFSTADSIVMTEIEERQATRMPRRFEEPNNRLLVFCDHGSKQVHVLNFLDPILERSVVECHIAIMQLAKLSQR